MAKKRILVATDFSDHANHALGQARRVGGPDADYLVVHAMPLLLATIHTPLLRAADRALFTEADEKAVRETEKALAKLVDDHEMPNCETRILHGSTAASVAQEAEKWGADLVVIGAGDHSKMEKILLGSQARAILRSAPTDVLVVRNPGPEIGAPYGRMLLATDFSDASKEAARKTRAWAEEWGADIDLVHAVDPELWWSGRASLEFLSAVADAVPTDRYRQVMTETLNEFNKSLFDGEAKQNLVLNRPAEGIRKAADETHANLIVVGTHSPGRVERFFLGSVAYGVATHAKQDVLVVRVPKKKK